MPLNQKLSADFVETLGSALFEVGELHKAYQGLKLLEETFLSYAEAVDSEDSVVFNITGYLFLLSSCSSSFELLLGELTFHLTKLESLFSSIESVDRASR